MLRCSSLAYWLSLFLFDYMIILLCILTIILSLNQLEFYEAYIAMTTINLLAFGSSIISMSYACSFLFRSSQTAYKIFPVINFLLLYSVPSIFETTAFIYISPFYALDQSLKHNTNYTVSFMIQTIFFLTIVYISEKRVILFTNYSPPNNHLLQARHISYHYTNIPVLKDVSFNIPSSRIISLLGPNGAGKSTLI